MAEVFVYIYDLSKGLADQLSHSLLGRHVSGIWHTGIVVYGQEIYFGSNGIESCPPMGTILGEPNRKDSLGYTEKSKEELKIHLSKLSENIFHGSKYDLLNHNCNIFSNELSIWLTGQNIPEYVTSLPRDFIETPFGQMIKPFISQFSPTVSTVYQEVATHYNQLTSFTSHLNQIYYKEPLGSEVNAFINGQISLFQQDYLKTLMNMIDSINEQSPSYITEQIIDLIVLTETNKSLDIGVSIAIFDVLRLLILQDIERVVTVFLDPLAWMSVVLTESSDDKLNYFKSKFFCNLVGKHFEIIKANQEILSLIGHFALQCLRVQSTVEPASSLIRNILINDVILDDDVLLDLSSYLIYILAEEQKLPNELTKENVVGSIYYLVKNSMLVKDLAKAQDIHKRIRRETAFCQLLYNELQ